VNSGADANAPWDTLYLSQERVGLFRDILACLLTFFWPSLEPSSGKNQESVDRDVGNRSLDQVIVKQKSTILEARILHGHEFTY
jgi:hypothetical protein